MAHNAFPQAPDWRRPIIGTILREGPQQPRRQHQNRNGARENCLVICIDYGTTYTGAAWSLTTMGEVPEVNEVRNWGGGEAAAVSPKVPSEFTYTANSGSFWGFGIDHDCYTMVRTKLELEPPNRLRALRDLRRTLDEAEHLGFTDENVLGDDIPRHLTKTSEDIVGSYLREIAYHVRQSILSMRSRDTLELNPIDLVITHPAIWHQRAKNITFRAAVSAFEQVFPEMNAENKRPGIRPGAVRLASESEACAQYTIHNAQIEGVANLNPGECFVVVDAGGGTVDLASYRVDSVNPQLRVTRITEVSGGELGSTLVDQSFQDLFEERLGRATYLRLLEGPDLDRQHHGGGPHNVQRGGTVKILTDFTSLKHRYAGPPPSGEDGQYGVIDLPPWLGMNDDPTRGVHAGKLRIYEREMERLFRRPVDGTIRLIHQQMMQVDLQGFEARAIVLSGGFANNEYLFNRVNNLARRHGGCTLHRASDCWLAVAKGGVLMGLGLRCDSPPASVKCPCRLGVVAAKRFTRSEHQDSQRYIDTFDGDLRARGSITWVVDKGDLVTPDEGIKKTINLVRKHRREGNRKGTVAVVLSSIDRPSVGAPLGEATDTTRREVLLQYDLDEVNEGGWGPNPGAYDSVEMRLTINIQQHSAQQGEGRMIQGHVAYGLATLSLANGRGLWGWNGEADRVLDTKAINL